MSETSQLPHTTGSAAGTGADGTDGAPRHDRWGMIAPLLLDVAVPVGGYYLLHAAFGLNLVLALALSSIVPAVRTGLTLVSGKKFNAVAALMLVVNVAGIALSFVTGNPRVMFAKDSGVSSVIGLAILVSAFGAKPLMSEAAKPLTTRGEAVRIAAWDRLERTSRRFQGLERLFSVIWGVCLLAECVARLVCAFTLPVSTMAWLSSTLTIGGIFLAIVLGGTATRPLKQLVDEAVAASSPAATAPAAPVRP
jgi:hypothetical protein